METKAENPVELLDGKNTEPFILVYFEICQLKQLYRQGWLRRGVSRARCESVADHSLATAVLALLLAQTYFPNLDANKVLCMALLHEIGEIYAGDLIPSDAISAQEKHRREASSVLQVLGKLPCGQPCLNAWEEFEQNETPEARFVHQIDRLEMGLQAGVYALQGLLEPDEFFASARQVLEDSRLVDLMKALEQTCLPARQEPEAKSPELK